VPGRIWPAATVQGLAACHARPTDQPAGPRPGSPVQPQRRPAARLVRVLRRTRCPRNGGVSTVRASVMRLMRWWWRGLTRAVTRRAGMEWRRRSTVPQWRRRSGHGGAGGRVLQHRRRGEKVRHMPLASHDARRTRLTEGAEGQRRRWLGLPVVRR
jgi:hypothetical protein